MSAGVGTGREAVMKGRMHTADVPQENPECFFFLVFRRRLLITDVQNHVFYQQEKAAASTGTMRRQYKDNIKNLLPQVKG